MSRLIAALLVIAAVSGVLAWGQHSPTGRSYSIDPINGFTSIDGIGTVGWSYHFDHNALKDAVLVRGLVLALTNSGNLASFDSSTLRVTGHNIVPGRGTAISLGNNGKVLVGAEDGRIFEVESATLALSQITRVSGRVSWVTAGKVTGKQSIVAFVDARPDVLPWPGESFRGFENRDARITRQVRVPLKVTIFTEGKSRDFRFDQKSIAIPSSFALDDNDRLWMGTDKGEWGGEYSYLNLRNGKIRTFETDSGVLGFLNVSDGRVLAYGGMSHMGFESGKIADVSRAPAVSLKEFSNRNKMEVPGEVKTVLDQARAKNPELAQGLPEGPIDLVLEDKARGGFLVLSEHEVFRCDREFAKWEKVADFGGRWSGGRNYSVGSTPSIHKILLSPDQRELVAISARDGLARIADGQIKDAFMDGQIEASTIEIWPTSIGVLFVDCGELHTAWVLHDNTWHQVRLVPDKPPSDKSGVWYFASPILDKNGVVAHFGSGRTPGERGFLRIDAQFKTEVLSSWTDDSSYYGTPILGMADASMLAVSENTLKGWNGAKWEPAGSNKQADADRFVRQLLTGRRYVGLSTVGNKLVLLDTAVGDLLSLSRSDKGFDLRPLTVRRGTVPRGIFDALAEGGKDLLIATATALLRFNPETGYGVAIPPPNTTEEFKTVFRDHAGRIWTAGDQLYVTSDEGKHWSVVSLTMLGPTYIKRIRETSPGTLAVALFDRGVLFISGLVQSDSHR